MSIIINDVNTRQEVDNLKTRVTDLENGQGGTSSDKYLQDVIIEHIPGGETIKPTNLTILENNCMYTDSDHLLTLSNPTHEVEVTTEEDGSIGDISTAAAPANGTDAANYWFITQLPKFVPMIGKKVKSMTFRANTTGTVTFAGSTVPAGYTETNGSIIGALYTNVKDAAQDMFTINATQGESTYLFDGTDNRVTFLNGLTEFIMPTTLGVKRNVNCGIIHNNTGTNSLAPRTGDDTDVLYGFIQNGSNPISYTDTGYQSFALNFVYEDTQTVEQDTGLRPVVTFEDTDLIVESNGAGGYTIFAEGEDGYGIVNGVGDIYWISKTTTDIESITGLDAIAHAPVVGFKIQSNTSLDVVYNDVTTNVSLTTVNSAFGTHVMDKFILGYSRGLSTSDISDGKLEYDFIGEYIENPTDRMDFIMNDGSHVYLDITNLVNPILKTINGNSIIGIGDIQTQTQISNLIGKKLSLIGDSITTYQGWLPSGNVTRYPRGTITNVEQTWWKKLLNDTGMVIGQNCAWDGSTCSGLSTSTTNAYAACSDKRITQLGLNGTPDIVICYIGINDWGATYNKNHTQYGGSFVDGAFVPVGSYTGESALPSGELKTFSEAYGCMIGKIQNQYPNAKIYCCTLPQTAAKSTYNYDSDGVFPSINRDGVSIADYNDCIRSLADNFGVEIIEFAKCGINWHNMSNYMEDGLHPNPAGMTLLANKAKTKLVNDFGFSTSEVPPTPVTNYTITNNLTHVLNSNSSTTISSGSSYSATLTPESGYNLQSVTITMDSVDITATVYNNGTITIGDVTGDLVITASATEQSSYSVTNNLTNVTTNNNTASVIENSSYTATLTPENHYTIGTVTITMGGTDITSSSYDNGVINIGSVTGNLVITATGNAITYTVTNTLSHATNSNSATSVIEGSSYTGTINADSGYEIETVTVTMGGTDITSTAYSNGTINIPSITGNLVITVTAEEIPEPEITWYTDFPQSSTSSFVASSRGWALDETTYANIYNKPINKISFVATASSGSMDFCIAPNMDAQSGFTNAQTINWTSANKSGNIVTIDIPEFTLTPGTYLCVYVNSTPATGAACYANGGNAGQFYSYVGSSGHSTWGGKGSYSIQMNLGYAANSNN